MFGAILTAMVTPFDSDLSVDEAACVALMHHLVTHGSDGLVMAGTTGEASTLTDPEKIRLFALAMREVGDRASVLANTGSNDTAHSVHLTHEAAALGCHGVLAVTPYYNKPPRAGIIGHFRAIAEVGLPVVVYNIPGRSVLNLDPGLLAELSEIPNIVGVKQAHDDLDELREIATRTDRAVWAGNDDLTLAVAELGGEGVISVASHLVGEQMGAMVSAVRHGNLGEARRLDAALRDLIAGLFVTANPILIKAALEMVGLIPSARVRLPLVEATRAERDALQALLAPAGVLSTR
ncbi:MAG: 4-hydroxy-tetrahydrodipicolinate synthase [Thermoleophilia bacterium]